MAGEARNQKKFDEAKNFEPNSKLLSGRAASLRGSYGNDSF
jgi:hypothetical protein